MYCWTLPPLKYDGAASLFIMPRLERKQMRAIPQMHKIRKAGRAALYEHAEIGYVVVINPQCPQLQGSRLYGVLTFGRYGNFTWELMWLLSTTSVTSCVAGAKLFRSSNLQDEQLVFLTNSL